MDHATTFTTFIGHRRLATGELATVLRRTREALDERAEQVLIFDDETGRQVEFDLRGSPDEVVAREVPDKPKGPGRPKLGVTSREVSLLPRHWDWLEAQPQGLSATLRRLIDQARSAPEEAQRARVAAASRFIWSIGGNLPDFEEVSRALFAADLARLLDLTASWPPDIRSHLIEVSGLARPATGSPERPTTSR